MKWKSTKRALYTKPRGTNHDLVTRLAIGSSCIMDMTTTLTRINTSLFENLFEGFSFYFSFSKLIYKIHKNKTVNMHALYLFFKGRPFPSDADTCPKIFRILRISELSPEIVVPGYLPGHSARPKQKWRSMKLFGGVLLLVNMEFC